MPTQEWLHKTGHFEMAPGRACDQGKWSLVVVRVWVSIQMSLRPPSPLKSELTLLPTSSSILLVRKASTLTSHVDRKHTTHFGLCSSLTGWLGSLSCGRIHLGLYAMLSWLKLTGRWLARTLNRKLHPSSKPSANSTSSAKPSTAPDRGSPVLTTSLWPERIRESERKRAPPRRGREEGAAF